MSDTKFTPAQVEEMASQFEGGWNHRVIRSEAVVQQQRSRRWCRMSGEKNWYCLRCGMLLSERDSSCQCLAAPLASTDPTPEDAPRATIAAFRATNPPWPRPKRNIDVMGLSLADHLILRAAWIYQGDSLARSDADIINDAAADLEDSQAELARLREENAELRKDRDRLSHMLDYIARLPRSRLDLDDSIASRARAATQDGGRFGAPPIIVPPPAPLASPVPPATAATEGDETPCWLCDGDGMRADRDRLDWLDASGLAMDWTDAPTLREAIDAARESGASPAGNGETPT